MTKEELTRLNEGSKLIDAISKFDKQIKNLDICTLLQIKGGDRDNQVVFDIPLQALGGHQFTPQAKAFVESYKAFIEAKKAHLQEQFDKL